MKTIISLPDNSWSEISSEGPSASICIITNFDFKELTEGRISVRLLAPIIELMLTETGCGGLKEAVFKEEEWVHTIGPTMIARFPTRKEALANWLLHPNERVDDEPSRDDVDVMSITEFELLY